MIDEYGNQQVLGSKEFKEYLQYRLDKEFCNDIACGGMDKELAIQYAHEFIGYAFKLQAEVEKLRKQLNELTLFLLWVEEEHNEIFHEYERMYEL